MTLPREQALQIPGSVAYLSDPDTRYTSCEPGKSPCAAVHTGLFYGDTLLPGADDVLESPELALRSLVATFRPDTTTEL